MTARGRIDLIEKLNGTNYKQWKFLVTLTLKSEDLWGVVEGTEMRPIKDTDQDGQKAWEKKDLEARLIISLTLDNRQIRHVYSCETAKEMFDRLKEVHCLDKELVLYKFMSYKMKKHQSPVQAMAEIESLADSLEEMGAKQEESTIIGQIISVLPKQYWHLRNWNLKPAKQISRDALRTRLKQHFVSETEVRERKARSHC